MGAEDFLGVSTISNQFTFEYLDNWVCFNYHSEPRYGPAVFFLCVAVLGMAGNAFSLAVWRMDSSSFNATVFFFKALALFDSIFLGTVFYYSVFSIDFDPTFLRHWFPWLLMTYAQLVSVHVTMLIGVIRWINITFPFRAQRLTTACLIYTSFVAVLVYCGTIQALGVYQSHYVLLYVGLLLPFLLLLILCLRLKCTAKTRSRSLPHTVRVKAQPQLETIIEDGETHYAEAESVMGEIQPNQQTIDLAHLPEAVNAIRTKLPGSVKEEPQPKGTAPLGAQGEVQPGPGAAQPAPEAANTAGRDPVQPSTVPPSGPKAANTSGRDPVQPSTVPPSGPKAANTSGRDPVQPSTIPQSQEAANTSGRDPVQPSTVPQSKKAANTSGRDPVQPSTVPPSGPKAANTSGRDPVQPSTVPQSQKAANIAGRDPVQLSTIPQSQEAANTSGRDPVQPSTVPPSGPKAANTPGKDLVQPSIVPQSSEAVTTPGRDLAKTNSVSRPSDLQLSRAVVLVTIRSVVAYLILFISHLILVSLSKPSEAGLVVVLCLVFNCSVNVFMYWCCVSTFQQLAKRLLCG